MIRPPSDVAGRAPADRSRKPRPVARVASFHPFSPGFEDPDARLLASVIPRRLTLRARLLRLVTTESGSDLRSAVRWFCSSQGRTCFLAALAGVALTLGFSRSEPSSTASAEPVATTRLDCPSTTLEVTPAATNIQTQPRVPSTMDPVDSKVESKGKKGAQQGRKAQRRSAASSSRTHRAKPRRAKPRRAKPQQAAAVGPLAAWLATQRSKDAVSSKRR